MPFLGMRLMMEDTANGATDYIKNLLSNSVLNPFLFYSPEDSRILSGEEEGLFAWIAANYLTHTFTKYGMYYTRSCDVQAF